jgi:hypothetical protein
MPDDVEKCMNSKLFVALLVLFSLSLPAQEKVVAPEPTATPTFDIEFAGGPLTDLLSQIARDTKKHPNIITTPESTQVVIPPFKLQGVSVQDLMYALERINHSLQISCRDNVITIGFQSKPQAGSEEALGKKSITYLTFNVDFPGGTVSELLLQIQKEAKIDPNVVCTADAAKVVLPAFKLHAVTMQNIASALGRINVQLQVMYKDNIVTLAVAEIPHKKPLRVEPYFIEKYLQNYQVEDIVTAIQTAWEMQSTPVSAKLKFHPQTNLLIAFGTIEELEVIRSTLAALQSGLPEQIRPLKLKELRPRKEKK